jgi:hypothetical protein
MARRFESRRALSGLGRLSTAIGGSRKAGVEIARMNQLGRLFLGVVVALGLIGCTHSDYMPNVIQLSPLGTAASPAPESITKSFTLTAVEDGYTGPFTAQTIVGTCWVVQAPITSGGAWVVVPQGSTCGTGEIDKIQVKDQKGNSAVTYIRSV